VLVRSGGRPSLACPPSAMHVLSVIHYPVWGGPHNRNSMVAPLLEQRGIRVTVLLPDEPGNAAERLRGRGMHVVQMPLGRLRRKLDPRVHVRLAAGLREEVRRIRDLIRREGVDLVLVNGLVNPQAAIAGHLERVAVTWQLLDTFAPFPLRVAFMPVVRCLADSVMTSGDAIARVHPWTGGLNARLVSFFPVVDVERFRPDPARRAAARRELGFSPDCVVVGNVSNLNPMKGHLTFVRAAGVLRRSRPDTRFVILGATYSHRPGYLDQVLAEAATAGLRQGRDLVVLDPQNRVAELAAAFDVFWLTSEPRSEGLPTVVGEAMALGVPVVATDVGAVSEAVGQNAGQDAGGLLVAPRDVDGLANTTLELIDDYERRRALGAAGRRRAVALYAAEASAERHLEAFAVALAWRRGRRFLHAPRVGSAEAAR